MKNRTILHMDMDAFYAAVEQRDHPEYQGKPVIIGADPKKGHGRGVVSTASYEAREFGIHSAQPISEAYRRCPYGIFLSVRGNRYHEVSRQIMSILADYSPCIEQISLDEAFLDLTGMQRLQGNAEGVAVQIRRRVFEQEGLTCSVGIGPNRLIAKIASDYHKPDGLTVIHPNDVLDFLRLLPVRRLWGIGKVAEQKLNRLGIRTVADVRRMSQKTLEQCFGAWGAQLWRYAHGIDTSPVGHLHQTKSLSNELTFERDVMDNTYLEHCLHQLCEKVGYRMRSHHLKGRTLFIKVRFTDFYTLVRNMTFQRPIQHGPDIFKEALGLFRMIDLAQAVRLIGIGFSQLVRDDQGQTDLFEKADSTNKVSEAMDTLKNKYGEKIIQRGII